jgi:hypothetical protein
MKKHPILTVARRLLASIIDCDSMAVYKKMDGKNNKKDVQPEKDKNLLWMLGEPGVFLNKTLKKTNAKIARTKTALDFEEDNQRELGKCIDFILQDYNFQFESQLCSLISEYTSENEKCIMKKSINKLDAEPITTPSPIRKIQQKLSKICIMIDAPETSNKLTGFKQIVLQFATEFGIQYIDEFTNAGITLLYRTITKGFFKGAAFLVAKGANLHKLSLEGKSPQMLLESDLGKQKRYNAAKAQFDKIVADNAVVQAKPTESNTIVSRPQTEAEQNLQRLAEAKQAFEKEEARKYIEKEKEEAYTQRIEAEKIVSDKAKKSYDLKPELLKIRATITTDPINLTELQMQVPTFIANGGDINEYCDRWGTVLHHACKSGNQNIVDYMVSQGADLNKRTLGQFSLTASKLLLNALEKKKGLAESVSHGVMTI